MGGIPDESLSEQFQAMAAYAEAHPQEFEQLVVTAAGGAAKPGKDAPAGLAPSSAADLLSKLREARALQETDADSKILGIGGSKRNEKGVIVVPTPGWVVKTREVSTDAARGSRSDASGDGGGKKVFINMCSSPLVGLPCLRKRLDDDGNEVDAYSYPISLGPPREDVDKSGAPCATYDCIFNPTVLDGAATDATGAERDALCRLAMQHVENKHKTRLDARYKLPKVAYKGDVVVAQCVRDAAAEPRIEEVSSTAMVAPTASSCAAAACAAAVRATATAAATAARREPPRPLRCRLEARWEDGEEDGAERRSRRVADVGEWSATDSAASQPPESWPVELVAVISGLSSAGAAAAMAVADENGGADGGRNGTVGMRARVLLSPFELCCAATGHETLRLLLPYAVVAGAAIAVTDPHAGTLTVTAAVDRRPSDAGPDPGSKPWLLARALADEDSGADDSSSGTTADAAAAAATAASGSSSGGFDRTAGALGCATDDAELPEDRFHLKLPEGHNKYNGLPDEGGGDGAAEETLPEDAFHSSDVMSQHLLVSREADRCRKRQRAKREREEPRAAPAGAAAARGPSGSSDSSDDGIEYIDIDEFKARGKHSSCSKTDGAAADAADEGENRGATGSDADAIEAERSDVDGSSDTGSTNGGGGGDGGTGTKRTEAAVGARLRAAEAVRIAVAVGMPAAVALSSSLYSQLLD